MLRKVQSTIKASTWIPPLLIRACAGLLFLSTGWQATHHLAEVSTLFAQLHLPLPSVSAALAGYAELICGALLIIGLASRLAAIPLLICMVVALATAKAPKVHGLQDLLMQVELAYAVLLVVFAIVGPGRLSLDELLARRRAGRPE